MNNQACGNESVPHPDALCVSRVYIGQQAFFQPEQVRWLPKAASGFPAHIESIANADNHQLASRSGIKKLAAFLLNLAKPAADKVKTSHNQDCIRARRITSKVAVKTKYERLAGISSPICYPKHIIMELAASLARLAQRVLLQKHPLNDLKSEVCLLKGDAGALISEPAKSRAIDLIVVGTVSRTGIAGLLIGNRDEKVLQRVNCRC